MFAQVLQNSVYTFAAILTVFLLALALGAFVARLLAERLRPGCSVRKRDRCLLSALLTISAIRDSASRPPWTFPLCQTFLYRPLLLWEPDPRLQLRLPWFWL